MGKRIDQFCQDLRIKLTSIDKNMDALKARIDGNVRTEEDVRIYLDDVTKRIDQDRAKVTAAQADIKKWIEERKTTTSEKIAEWKSKREMAKLQGRAESAERYAAASQNDSRFLL